MWPYSKWREQLFRLIQPTDAYYQHWVRFRLGLLVRVVAVVIFIPVFLGATALFGLVLNSIPAQVAGIIVALLVGIILMSFSPLNCPRCRHRFFSMWWSQQQASVMERCIHCGLQLYAPHGDL